MSLPLKWSSVKDCASTLYACKFKLDESAMISTKPDRERNNSREKKSRTKIEDTEQPSIADKDYIVFKFNGKGGIDLVEEKSPPRNQDPAGKNRNQKGSKKAVFDECSESLQFKVGEDGGMISDNEVEESSVQSSKKLPLSEVKGEGDDTDVIIEVKESTPQKTLSESTRSDSSAGSFAFPVVNVEMNGSPERMPKYNEHKKIERILRFPCCKF